MQEILKEAIPLRLKYRNKPSTDKDSLKDYLDNYDNFQMSTGEVIVYNNLGKNMNIKSILDIGCGTGMTIKCLLKEVKSPVNYTSIDFKQIPDIENLKINTWKHIDQDFFEIDFSLFTDTYDIVIIDIEPHGKEIDVYEKLKHLMNVEHLCILKHVSYIDLYGACLADKFIHKYIREIKDYFAESNNCSYSNIRDVFVIFGMNQDIQLQKLAVGNLSNYVDKDIIGYCLSHY
jgi:SAM-dependent methyltransferase